MERIFGPVHEHDLIIREKVDGDYKVFWCRGCDEKIQGQVPYWWCTLCEDYFHEACAKLALEVKLFFHPCSIVLHYIPRGFTCNSCFGWWSGIFTYHCKQCHFYICVKCTAQTLSVATGSGDDGETEQILHCCHRHPLQPLALKSSESMCQICDRPCSSTLTLTWGCDPCNFHLHKPCLDFLPETVVQTKLDAQVASWVLIRSSFAKCSRCDKSIRSKLLYRRAGGTRSDLLCIFCRLLRSLIDESSSSEEVRKVINHFIHPSHGLKLILSPNSSACNACLLNHHPFSYHCKTCDFFLCFDCAQLPPLHHWHPLKLLPGTQDTIGTPHICHLCERLCSEPFYSCIDLCRFYVHKSCMDSLPHKTSQLLLNPTLVLLHVLAFECIRCNRECSGLTFYCSQRKCMFCVKCVLWPEDLHVDDGRFKSILHRHQLSLCETRIEDKRRRCFLCKELCIAWCLCYKCSECALFFHKSCAELPMEFEHPIHPQHRLTLTNRSSALPNEAMTCNLCLKSLSQSFPLYRCHLCSFQLDTQCATNLLPSIEYKGHPHLLYVVVNMHGNINCRVCGKSCKGSCTIFCAHQECDFCLHLQCGPLPYMVNHVCHVHPLTLKDYYVEDNGSDKFACHICEEYRDPRLRVYCCSRGCLMICDVKCMLNEVLPLLRGEHGEVELRTPFPQVACNVISNKSMMLDATIKGAGEGIQKIKHIFSFQELLASVTDFDSDEEETFGIETLEEEEENKLDDKLRSECGEEDEHEEEIKVEFSDRKTATSSVLQESTTIDKEVPSYSFSLMALSRFEKSLRTPSYVNLGNNFLREYDGSVMTGAYELPEILGQIYEEFFGTYNIIGDKCKLNYFRRRFLVFITCSVLHHMRITKVVDVTKETILKWLGWIGYVEEKGDFNVKIVAENIKKLWRAHYYIQSKEIVDDKSSRLERKLEQVCMYKAELRTKMDELRTKMDEAEAEHQKLQVMDKQHETYRVVGSRGPMKYVRVDALEIKWRSCYDSLVTYPGNLPAK